MTSNEQLVYLAGFMDGEGSICVWRDKRGYLSKSLFIGNTHRWVLEWIKLLFGGNVYGPYKRKILAGGIKSAKPLYCWQLTGRNAVLLIECLLPFLKVKKEKAKLFIIS